jgi:peptidyl-prolyl cis-trans isomerase B (cyclophilin B)
MGLPLVAALLFAVAADEPATPKVADEHIVLHTIAGDIVIALYPEVAPEHTKQLIRLTKVGVFDSTHFGRVEPGIVMQLLTGESDRALPLTAAQQAAIQPIKAEFSNLPHQRGTVSMARGDDPDGATTSFSIVLGREKSTHLDGQYTIFGRVESGMDVVDSLIKVPLTDGLYMIDGQYFKNRPIKRLAVTSAEVLTTEQLKHTKLQPAVPVTLDAQDLQQVAPPARSVSVEEGELGPFLIGSAVLIMAVSLTGFMISARYPKAIGSLLLINMMIGGFLVFVLLVPKSPPSTAGGQFVAAVVFFALLGMLKLMGRFESPS